MQRIIQYTSSKTEIEINKSINKLPIYKCKYNFATKVLEISLCYRFLVPEVVRSLLYLVNCLNHLKTC